MTATNLSHGTRPEPWSRRSPIIFATASVSVIFLVVGLAGFVPGLTSNLDDIEFAGHESGAELLGVFQISILHNLVHLGFGLVGLIAARASVRAARTFLLGGGAVYLVLFAYGVVVDHDHDANFVPFNDADDWLHLGLGALLIVLGLVLADRPDRISVLDES